MRIDVFTIFPEMFNGPLNESILKRAQEKKILSIKVHDLRDYAYNKHRNVDDTPYGGGAGMVMRPEPFFEAVETLLKTFPSREKERRIILLSPQGKIFNQQKARELAGFSHLIFLCGHYEGFDERIREYLVDEEISIGDYVLTGGELPAMVVIDSVSRMIPGVLGREVSAEHDSFADGLLEHPHYTRPSDYRGWAVPEVLLSGDHEKIRLWRREQSLLRTLKRRPELLLKANLNKEDKKLLVKLLEQQRSGG